jgi:pimeloyl-ACP methyl ester carboxylesterase
MDSLLPLDGDSRDLLVATMVAQLGGSDRGLLADIGSGVARLAVSLGATRPVERRRFAITRSATLTAGDVVLYLARGDGIRSFIREQIIATSNDNVVIVAHSLGAIAAVDLLATKDRDVALGAVSMLLTFGTQAPLLYELNALPNLEFGEHLPERFPEWVNVFDPRDLLAFTASEVFHGRPQDRIIDNRTPFPRSHSAYLGNKRFYQILDGVLP